MKKIMLFSILCGIFWLIAPFNAGAGDEGTLKWSYETEGTVDSSSAIGVDETIDVGLDGLYAIYSNSMGIADSPWPMGGHGVRRIGRAPQTLFATEKPIGTNTYSLSPTSTMSIKVMPGQKMVFTVAAGGAGAAAVDEEYIWSVSDGLLIEGDDGDKATIHNGASIAVRAPRRPGVYSVAVYDGEAISSAKIEVVSMEAVIISLELSGDTSSMAVGEKRGFSLIGVRPDGKRVNLTGKARWSSTDSSVLRQLDSGVFEAVASGDGVIKASYGAREASVNIKVVDKGILGIRVEPSIIQLSTGSSQRLRIKGLIAGGGAERELATGECALTPDNTDALSVASDGLLNALMPGQGLLTIECSGKSAVIPYLIAPKLPLTVTPASMTVAAGEGGRFTVRGGAPPYTAVARIGTVEMSHETIDYTSTLVAGSDVITVTDSLGNEFEVEITMASPLLVTPLAVDLELGGKVKLKASGGSGSFSWSVSAGTISSTTESEVEYTAPSVEGAYYVTVQDDLGQSKTVTVNVALGLLATPEQFYISPGEKKEFKVTGGAPPYDVSVSAGSVKMLSDGAYEYEAPDISGKYFITVTDSYGDTVMIDVRAGAPLTVTPEELFLDLGEEAEIMVTGGFGKYRAEADAGDVSVEANTITYKAPSVKGNYLIHVIDEAGGIQEVSVQVSSDKLFVNRARLYLLPSESADVMVFGGTEPYTWTIDGEGVIEEEKEGAGEDGNASSTAQVRYTAPQLTGNYALKVTDGEGREATCDIVVYTGALKTIPEMLILEPGETAQVQAVMGLSPYEWAVSSSGPDALSDTEGKKITYTAPASDVDSDIIIIEDATGHRQTVRVVISSEEIEDIVELYAGSDKRLSEDEMERAIGDFMEDAGWLSVEEMYRLIELFLTP